MISFHTRRPLVSPMSTWVVWWVWQTVIAVELETSYSEEWGSCSRRSEGALTFCVAGEHNLWLGTALIPFHCISGDLQQEIPWSGMGTIHVLYRTEIWGQGAGTRAKSWESKFQAAMQPHVSPISASNHIVKYLQQLWGAWFWLRPLPVYGFGGVHVPLPIVQDHPYLKWLDHGTCFRVQDPKNPAYLQLRLL